MDPIISNYPFVSMLIFPLTVSVPPSLSLFLNILGEDVYVIVSF
jgi:hypothetical protein